MARAAVNRLLESCFFKKKNTYFFVVQFVLLAPGAILCSVSVMGQVCVLSVVVRFGRFISGLGVIVTVLR